MSELKTAILDTLISHGMTSADKVRILFRISSDASLIPDSDSRVVEEALLAAIGYRKEGTIANVGKYGRLMEAATECGLLADKQGNKLVVREDTQPAARAKFDTLIAAHKKPTP